MKKIISFLTCVCGAFVMGNAQIAEGRIEYSNYPTLREQNLTFSLQDENLVISGHLLADYYRQHFLGYKVFEDSVYLYRIEDKVEPSYGRGSAYPVNIKIGNCPGKSYKVCLAGLEEYPVLDLVVSREPSFSTCLPVNGAEWVMSMVRGTDWNFETNWGMAVFKIVGDTLMNEKTYHKLYFYEWPGRDSEATPPAFREICALRMEGKKVWSTFNEGKYENLLYDFGADVGDTIWHGKYEMDCGFPIYPDGKSCSVVESVQLTPNGRELEVTTYSYFDWNDEPYALGTDVWIEGVGSLCGFWGNYIPQLTCGSGYERKLWKLTENQVLVYPKVDPGILPHALNTVEGSVSLEIKYDSSSQELSVRSNETIYPCQLKIMNVQGNVTHSYTLSEDTRLSIHGLSSGTYICSVLKDRHVIKTEKIWK